MRAPSIISSSCDWWAAGTIHIHIPPFWFLRHPNSADHAPPLGPSRAPPLRPSHGSGRAATQCIGTSLQQNTHLQNRCPHCRAAAGRLCTSYRVPVPPYCAVLPAPGAGGQPGAMAAIAEKPAEAEEERPEADGSSDALAAVAPNAIHISTADGDSEPLQLPSLCMRCHETVRRRRRAAFQLDTVHEPPDGGTRCGPRAAVDTICGSAKQAPRRAAQPSRCMLCHAGHHDDAAGQHPAFQGPAPRFLRVPRVRIQVRRQLPPTGRCRPLPSPSRTLRAPSLPCRGTPHDNSCIIDAAGLPEGLSCFGMPGLHLQSATDGSSSTKSASSRGNRSNCSLQCCSGAGPPRCPALQH